MTEELESWNCEHRIPKFSVSVFCLVQEQMGFVGEKGGEGNSTCTLISHYRNRPVNGSSELRSLDTDRNYSNENIRINK